MGCDIHTFIEYSDFNDRDGEPYWTCFGGSYNPGRDYTMFGILAGVRHDEFQMFEPRGLPEGKLSYPVQDYMRIRIADEGTEPSEGEVSLEQARSWTGYYGETITEFDGKPRWVGNPDLHSHSWLTAEEFKLALARYVLRDREPDIDVTPENRVAVMQAVAALAGGDRYDVSWDAILAVMETFEARGCKTRLVFCFDN